MTSRPVNVNGSDRLSKRSEGKEVNEFIIGLVSRTSNLWLPRAARERRRQT
jgi:hypothetical protein